jgi:hypothetical protein
LDIYGKDNNLLHVRENGVHPEAYINPKVVFFVFQFLHKFSSPFQTRSYGMLGTRFELDLCHEQRDSASPTELNIMCRDLFPADQLFSRGVNGALGVHGISCVVGFIASWILQNFSQSHACRPGVSRAAFRWDEGRG